MSAPSKNIVLALESFHCNWAKRKEQGRASPEVGTWKGFSQVHQELAGRTANGHLISWVLGLNFTCWRAFPGQFFFFYILLYSASFPSKNPLVAGSAARASCRGLSSTRVLQQGWSISAFGSASAPLLAARGKGKCQGEPVPSACWLIAPYLQGAFSDCCN